MLSNVITLTVDETNDGATTPDVDHEFTRFDTYNTRSVFHRDNHSVDMRDTLGFYRTVPKPNGIDRGNLKTSFKFTKDIQVTGKDGVSILTKPIIFELNATIPVGATSEEIMRERQKAVSLLDDDVIMCALNETQSI